MRARVAVACGISPREVEELPGADYVALVRVLVERAENRKD